MSEEISALLDGELTEREGFEQIDFMNGDRERRKIWETYSLIGDVLRGHNHAGCAARVSSRIAVEPVLISPIFRLVRRSPSDSVGQKWFAMSAAAVISAIAFVAWVSLPMMANPNHEEIARIPSGSPVADGTASDTRTGTESASPQEVGGYIMAHQQFSPSNSMQGVATYVRLVSEETAGASR